MPVTNEQIYEICQEILSAVRNYNEQEISMLRDVIERLERVIARLEDALDRLDRNWDGIVTLSDNQAVIDEKIESIISTLSEVIRIVRELRAVLPGV